MCCDDPDDFEKLKARAWDASDFRDHDLVELWPADCTGPPGQGDNAYARSGRVLTTLTAAGERDDDLALSIARRTRSRQQARWAEGGAGQKLILEVFGDRDVGWARIEQVQLVDGGCDGAGRHQAWTILSRPRALRVGRSQISSWNAAGFTPRGWGTGV